ncbi:ATP-binding protein [Elusimicrobiota bacterium]
MPVIKRYLHAQVSKDLAKKMVFIGGPRQVGKTTFAKTFIKDRAGYLNWDISSHREKILKDELPSAKLWIFDEIHKYRSWRNYLKGIYDLRGADRKIMVTGSARLDFYRYGGDSLQGRYHYLRLYPLTVAELKIGSSRDLESLMMFGGFPEPFFGASQVEARRWSREYRSRLVRDDIASIDRIQDLGNLELLVMRLPDLVGSPLSINALREDIQVSHKAVSNWLKSLERMYSIFRISPFGPPRVRAVKKEQKHYHFDWSLIPEPSLRFENLVALHILKWVHFEQDAKGRDLDLRYFRDVDGREVDFVVTEGNKPIMFIESKLGDSEIGKGFKYLKARFPKCESWQISARGKKDYVSSQGIRVSPAVTFLKKLV